ncbi:MAG: endo-alpha-N-acetylgalactosaminidase family protein [Terriglobia bacterium]
MNKKDRIARRDFLKAGGAGLAGLISSPSWAGLPPSAAHAAPSDASAEAPARSRPVDPVVLRSSSLEVILDRNDGLPYEYRLLPVNLRMRGEDTGGKIGATLCRRAPWGFASVSVTASSVTAGKTQADFHFEAAYEGAPAAAFVIRYTLDGSTVFVSMDSIEEREGYQLIEAALPRLATVREEDGPAWLAHGEEGGSLVALSEAAPGHLPPNRFWGKVLATLPVVMIGTERAMCVLEVTAYMDGTEMAVAGGNGRRRATLGTVKTHRVNGSLCYDMNTGNGTPRNCGNAETPNLLVEQRSLCRLDFLSSPENGPPLDWLDGARLARQRMPAMPTHYYDNKLVYAIHCDEPRWPEPRATFEQAEKLIRDVAALTDGWPQIAHLWGWQYRGKDTGYPAVAEVNPRIGSYDGLMRLMEEARKSNCNATLSDNYDDAYKSSPAWDPAMIARRPDGQLWESRAWTGENSYIIGLAKYMKGPGVSRTDYTCKRYKLLDTIHTDVLTYYSIRNDWDHEHPASGVKDLTEGRYKVLSEFAKYGVDVSSEALRYAFIGKVSYYWYAQGPAPCPFGGKPIPLLPMIYRQSAAWGQSGRAPAFADKMLKMLFYNGCPRAWITSGVDPKTITDWVYLMMLPWFKTHRRAIESFQREGEKTIIGLEGTAHIDLDWQNKTYSVSAEGAEIARDGNTFCPVDGERIAFYSLAGGDLLAPLPEGWNAADIAALGLSIDKPNEIKVTVEKSKITVHVPPQQPVMVYRDGAAARKRLQGAV